MNTTLTKALACERVGDGEYALTLEDRWLLPYGAVFGGAMMAGPLAALAAHTGGRNLLAASCHFARAGQLGPAAVTIEDIKQGRTTSTHRATLHQASQPVVTVLATVGPEAHGTPTFADPPPALPDRDECTDPRQFDIRPNWVPYLDVLAPTSGQRNFLAGEHFDEPALAAWVRLRDGEQLDGARLALLADDWPPAPWMLGTFGIMRTVELNLHLFRSGHADWMTAQVRTQAMFEDLFTVGGTLWSDDGRPLAEWRQVALFEAAEGMPSA